MQLTFENHLRAARSKNGDSLFVSVGSPNRPLSSPFLEARRAAKLIAQDAAAHGEELWLCLSGGIDSEAMARSFLEEKLPFRVAILRFENKFNLHDIADAVRFCEDHQIEFRFFDLEILSFLENGEVFRYAKEFYCRSPQIAAHLKLLELIPGMPVLSWNPTAIHWVNSPGGKTRLAFPAELHLAYHRFFEIRQKRGVGFFFIYTPELFYSFFHTPTLREQLFQEGAGQGEVTTYHSKYLAYKEGGFSIEKRVDKYTGFEKIKDYYAAKYHTDHTFFDRVFRRPLEALYPDPIHHFSKISRLYLPEPSKKTNP